MYSTAICLTPKDSPLPPLGRQQILVGYYDGPVVATRSWLDDGRDVLRIVGAVYITWQHRYDDLETFARHLQGP
jgi:hypothetical protein